MPRASELRQLLRNRFLNRGLSAVQHENCCELTLNKFSGNITVAAGCKISRSTLSGEVNVAAYTSINGPNVGIFSKLNPINIGKFCSIASGVRIQEFNHFASRVSTYFIQKNIFNAGIDSDIESNGPILIDDDVWVGANAIILSGVSIGKGVIIAAGSVVTKNVPAYAICAGVPAKVVRFRFSQPVIDCLNELNWTSWEIEKIRRNKDFFMLTGDAILGAQIF